MTNDSSAYFNKVLFPKFNNFERKLRKLLYLKSALSLNLENSKNIKDLEEKDLGEIFDLLFSDEQFINGVKASVNKKTWKFTKAEILTSIKDIKENVLWDNLIDDCAVPELRSRFVDLRKFRNDIMHAHNMNYNDFSSAKNLIEKINKQLDSEINKIIVNKEIKNKDNKTDQQNFNALISNAIKILNEKELNDKKNNLLITIEQLSSIIDLLNK